MAQGDSLVNDCITIAAAERELKIAGDKNPGLWVSHSHNVGLAAKYIADACKILDSDKAYICGLLHDIGRRNGVSALKHTIDGYDYAISKNWNEVAKSCLTHSFPIKDVEADIAVKDVTPEQYQFMKRYLESVEYDDYDKLIILCDALADAQGFCILEKRFIDTTRRYGIHPFTVERWNKTYEYKTYFEDYIGKSIYAVLPGICDCIFR